MKAGTYDPSTTMLATHCYAMLMSAMPAIAGLAAQHGILLTEDALNMVEDAIVTCLIQSTISLARERGFAAKGIDFAIVDGLQAGKAFVEFSKSPEFRKAMEEAHAASLNAQPSTLNLLKTKNQ